MEANTTLWSHLKSSYIIQFFFKDITQGKKYKKRGTSENF